MIRFVQIALLFAVMVGHAAGQPRETNVLKNALDRFTECSITAFVDHEMERRDRDPERAFSRCATEEQQVVGAMSLLHTEQNRRLAYGLFLKRKAELKDDMVRIGKATR